MAKYNLKKDDIPVNLNKQLEKSRDEQNTHEPDNRIIDKLLDRKDEKGEKSIEKKLEDSRTSPKGDVLTEALIDKELSSDLPKRGENDKHNVIPINVLDALSEKKREKAFNLKTENSKGSQLHDNPDRFTNNKVKDMVMASLKDADAVLFFIYKTASKENRELNEKEQKLVDGINNDKKQILERLFDV
jgi:hypothetical protein